jgi:Uma2 family endonuclease
MSLRSLSELDIQIPWTPTGDPDALFEIIDGQHVELPPMGAYEVLIGSRLVAVLEAYAKAGDLGQAVMEMLFDLRPMFDRNRRPDVAYVSYERWARGKRIPPGNAWAVIPELVVEVVSPHDSADDLLVKIREFFQAGSKLVWLIYTGESQVYVYESPSQVRILTRAETLDGGAALPGFSLPIASLLGE